MRISHASATEEVRKRNILQRWCSLGLLPLILLFSAGCEPQGQASAPRKSNRPKGVVAELDFENFKQVIGIKDQPVLVDFWAPWCGPCLEMAPIVDEIAQENGHMAVFGKVNIDDHPGFSEHYGIKSIPVFMIFKDGELLERYEGMQPKETLVAGLKKHASAGE